jgi:hypothetical protein
MCLYDRYQHMDHYEMSMHVRRNTPFIDANSGQDDLIQDKKRKKKHQLHP